MPNPHKQLVDELIARLAKRWVQKIVSEMQTKSTKLYYAATQRKHHACKY